MARSLATVSSLHPSQTNRAHQSSWAERNRNRRVTVSSMKAEALYVGSTSVQWKRSCMGRVRVRPGIGRGVGATAHSP